MTAKKASTTNRDSNPRQPSLASAKREVSVAAASPAGLLAEIRALILQARQTVAQGVNSALVLLYWQIGQRIRTDILEAKRADYGEQISHALSGNLSWTHLRRVAHIDDPLTSGIHLASYLTKLLPKKQLMKKLHQAVHLARQRLHADSIEGQT